MTQGGSTCAKENAELPVLGIVAHECAIEAQETGGMEGGGMALSGGVKEQMGAFDLGLRNAVKEDLKEQFQAGLIHRKWHNELRISKSR